jgi:hypothetical protein
MIYTIHRSSCGEYQVDSPHYAGYPAAAGHPEADPYHAVFSAKPRTQTKTFASGRGAVFVEQLRHICKSVDDCVSIQEDSHAL